MVKKKDAKRSGIVNATNKESCSKTARLLYI